MDGSSLSFQHSVEANGNDYNASLQVDASKPDEKLGVAPHLPLLRRYRSIKIVRQRIFKNAKRLQRSAEKIGKGKNFQRRLAAMLKDSGC